MVPTRFWRALCLLLAAQVTDHSAAYAFFTGTPPSSSSLLHHAARPPTFHYCNHGRIRQREGIIYAGTGPGLGPTSIDPATVLRTAVDTRKVPAEEVSEALRALAEDSGPPPTVTVDDVEGSWQLVFSTQLAKGYMPIRELVGFYPSREEATIDATAGPLPIGGMRGQCWWKGGPENELEFTMGAVKLGPFKIGKDKNEVKSYKFFVNDGKILAAKSSSGGFALLSRVMLE